MGGCFPNKLKTVAIDVMRAATMQHRVTEVGGSLKQSLYNMLYYVHVGVHIWLRAYKSRADFFTFQKAQRRRTKEDSNSRCLYKTARTKARRWRAMQLLYCYWPLQSLSLHSATPTHRPVCKTVVRTQSRLPCYTVYHLAVAFGTLQCSHWFHSLRLKCML